MNTRIHIHEHGSMLTMRINSMAMGLPITATLSGPLAYALIDGLLWWCINRKLDALVATSQRATPPADRDTGFAFAASLSEGEELVMHCFATPFHERPEERQARIVRYISDHLTKLQGLTYVNAQQARAELAELSELCTLLHDRLQHSGEAYHGLDGMVQRETAAAA